MHIYAPLALRLGLFRIKTELENLSFKYEHPNDYTEIVQKLEETSEERNAFYQVFQAAISHKLAEMGYQFSMTGRVKTPFSIWRKMQNSNIPFDEVYDKLAVRIVFKPKEDMSENEQCWMLYSAITQIYKPHPERIRDWVSTPKANGYEALHVTVMGQGGKWVEVQIRSQRMHEIAERGIAAHWKYKHGCDDSSESELDKWLKTIKELLENPEPSAIDFIDTFKLDLFAQEIFVFTPKGDIKTIAADASALDFAFLLHSDLGERCIGAKVNHKLEPLSYKLKSGDQIEILTSKKQTPQPEWLEFVTTARARQKLQTYFRKEEKAFAVKGQRKLEETLKKLHLSLQNENIIKILNYYHITQPEELYREIGKGILSLDELEKEVFKPQNKGILKKYLKNPFRSTAAKLPQNTPVTIAEPFRIDMKKTLMLTEETAGKLYELAPCCHPIPGDEVLGYVDDETGVSIHKRVCPVAAKLRTNFGQRIISAEWATHKLNSYLEQIEIKGLDRKGVMVEVMKVISETYGFNMGGVHIETHDGIFTGQIFVYVHDTNEINELCRQLGKKSFISSVRRIQEIKN